MIKVNPKSLKNLKKAVSKWEKTDTCTIRVPKALKGEILGYGHKLDRGEINTINDDKSAVTLEQLNLIIDKIKSKTKGYKSNSASQLIKDLIELVEQS